MQFECKGLKNVFLVPKEFEKYLKNATLSELKVALYIFSNGGNIDGEDELSNQLSIPESEVKSALAFWRGTGLISKISDEKEKTSATVTIKSDTPVSEKSVSYSSAELASAIEKNNDIRSLLNFASQKIGKILTPAEQGCIYSLVDVLSMDCELVMGIIEYCTGNGHSSVRYIERTAAKMYTDDGIDNFAKLEEYIRQKNNAKLYEEKIRKIMGIENRAFTKKEREIIEDFSQHMVDEQLISAAYERTVNSISKPSLQYMAKIITTWREKGINKAEEIEMQKPFLSGDMSSLGAFTLSDFAERPKKE